MATANSFKAVAAGNSSKAVTAGNSSKAAEKGNSLKVEAAGNSSKATEEGYAMATANSTKSACGIRAGGTLAVEAFDALGKSMKSRPSIESTSSISKIQNLKSIAIATKLSPENDLPDLGLVEGRFALNKRHPLAESHSDNVTASPHDENLKGKTKMSADVQPHRLPAVVKPKALAAGMLPAFRVSGLRRIKKP
jgi:hypothetical protein